MLHYIPMCERKDEAPGKDCGEIAHERQQADGELFPSYMFFVIFWGKEIVKSLHLTVFQDYHSTQFTWSNSCPSWSPCSPTSACRMTQEIWKPLQMRWSYSAWYICPQKKVVKFKMHLNYWSESQLLSVQVWREFKTIFRQQEQMKTFPPYDGMDDRESQWGRKSANMAVCKEANWIPFIQVWGKQISIWQNICFFFFCKHLLCFYGFCSPSDVCRMLETDCLVSAL